MMDSFMISVIILTGWVATLTPLVIIFTRWLEKDLKDNP